MKNANDNLFTFFVLCGIVAFFLFGAYTVANEQKTNELYSIIRSQQEEINNLKHQGRKIAKSQDITNQAVNLLMWENEVEDVDFIEMMEAHNAIEARNGNSYLSQ